MDGGESVRPSILKVDGSAYIWHYKSVKDVKFCDICIILIEFEYFCMWPGLGSCSLLGIYIESNDLVHVTSAIKRRILNRGSTGSNPLAAVYKLANFFISAMSQFIRW